MPRSGMMTKPVIRLLHAGLPQAVKGQRMALIIFMIMITPVFQPVGADLSVAKDDFGILDAMTAALAKRSDSGEDKLAQTSAEAVLSAVTAKGRVVADGDAILATEGVIGSMSMRDTTPSPVDHPRPYEMLTNTSTHPPGWPNNLLDTLFSPPEDFSDPLAFGINSYALYVNYTARDNGPQYENWTYGTFTGEILTFTEFSPFMNRIDLDGDGADDVEVGLTVLGLGQFGEGWGFELNGLLLEKIWIKPTFQWRIDVLNPEQAMWDDLGSMEVSLMKGFAYDLSLTEVGESYAMVLDSRFTQPPNEFEVRVGLDLIEFGVTETVELTIGQLLSLATSAVGIGQGVNESSLEILSVSAPYSIYISNPDLDSTNTQSRCEDTTGYYDPEIHHLAESRSHRCAFGIGIGYVHFAPLDEQVDERDIFEMGYLDIGLHPVAGQNQLPNEIDFILRSDGENIAGVNSYDTIEIYSDKDIDLWFHYFEDRSNYIVGGEKHGNLTDSRGWIRGLPGGELHQDEITAIFTMIGNAPSDDNFPGQFPTRLSLIIAIKNFTADDTQNADDDTLPVNPSDTRWNSLILIAGTERITSLTYESVFQRHGYSSDRSAIKVEFIDIPEVLVIFGTFEIPSTTRSRVEFGNAPDLFSQFFDNIILNLVEIILDVGTIINGLPEALVGTAGSSGGEIIVQCYNQVKQTLPSGSTRIEVEIEMINAAIASSDQPVMLTSDHIILAENLDLPLVQGRYGAATPLVPISMSIRMGNVSGFHYSYDQINDIRQIGLTGTAGSALVIGHLIHNTGTTDGLLKQFASISNRPGTLNITQSGVIIDYSSSSSIDSITYSGEGGGQQNSLRLIGLSTDFSIELGDILGFVSKDPITAIEIQISNATTPLTMNGDHIRYWVDEAESEASLSVRISDVTRVNQFPPTEPGADGPLGNSRIEIERSNSRPLSILIDDVTIREDKFRGLSGRGYIDPLPANISFSVPSSGKTDLLKVPDFGEDSGVLALSFFLGEMISFGGSINDFAHNIMVDLGDISGENNNMTLGLDLVTDEEFNLTLDMRKGRNVQTSPKWVHGLSGEFYEATELEFNLSRMPAFTETSRGVWAEAISDGIVNDSEYDDAVNALTWGGVNQSRRLVNLLSDGYISDSEIQDLDLDLLLTNGVNLSNRRAWWARMWMPNLPAGNIVLGYELTFVENVPTFEIDIEMDNYMPARPIISVLMNGLKRSDVSIIIDGLNTELSRDMSVNAFYSTESDRVIPRFSIDLNYDVGETLSVVEAHQINHLRGIRSDIMMFGAPRSATLSATIGDVLIADLFVPIEYRTNSNSAESIYLQQLRFIENRWWPSTLFMRDIPSEMHLAALPSSEFNINRESTFQGMYTLDYTSNSDQMDLFLETKGKAQNVQGGNLMIAENLPDRFVMETTDDWGARISASGNGVERIYLKRTNSPMQPGYSMNSAQIIGEDLKSVTIHIHRYAGVPVVILDDITSGRIVVTSDISADIMGFEIDGRGVLLDAQFTGVIPTASSLGINGVVTDLSLIGELTGGSVETTHIMMGEPVSTLISTIIATVVG